MGCGKVDSCTDNPGLIPENLSPKFIYIRSSKPHQHNHSIMEYISYLLQYIIEFSSYVFQETLSYKRLVSFYFILFFFNLETIVG
jgi:hypothetical protein